MNRILAESVLRICLRSRNSHFAHRATLRAMARTWLDLLRQSRHEQDHERA